jgi:hypothetical protein
MLHEHTFSIFQTIYLVDGKQANTNTNTNTLLKKKKK